MLDLKIYMNKHIIIGSTPLILYRLYIPLILYRLYTLHIITELLSILNYKHVRESIHKSYPPAICDSAIAAFFAKNAICHRLWNFAQIFDVFHKIYIFSYKKAIS